MGKRLPKYDRFNLFTKFSLCFFDKPKEWNLSMKIDNNGDFKVTKDTIAKASKFYLKEGVAFAMYINKKKYHYSHAIHESTHIIDFLIEEIGIDHKDMEFRAYMIEDLSVRIIEHCRVKYE